MAKIPRYVHIDGKETLVRDTFSMGVINTNQIALEQAKKAHKLAVLKIGEQRRKDIELNSLRKDVDELRKLVTQLLESR